jgi:hypothetical protein
VKINASQFATIAAAAKTKAAGNAKWIRAIDRAAITLANGELIVTTLRNGAQVTSANGSYRIVAGCCSCPAAKNGHRECYHVAAARLVERLEAVPAVEPKRQVPIITRSIECQHNGARVEVVRCNGWMI